jgi:dolichyl-diphosphooligosaccharide--protein glycosyltransferase
MTSKKKKSDYKISDFFENKYTKVGIYILMFLILFYFIFSLRTGTVDLEGLEERIVKQTESNIRGIIEEDLRSQYLNNNNPSFENFVSKEVEKRFEEAKENGYFEINGTRYMVDYLVDKNVNKALDAYKFDENNQSYLIGYDPYFFFRKAENYDKNGAVGDIVIDGVSYETKTLAPIISEEDYEDDLHAIIMSFFIDHTKSDAENTKSIYLLPVYLVALCSIPLFFLMKKYSNDIVAFLTTFFLMSYTTFVTRTIAGFVDTDAYVVLFPILITLMIVFSIKAKSSRDKIIYGLLSGLSLGLYMWSWESGWFFFLFILISIILWYIFRFVYHILNKKEKSKSILIENSLPIISYLFSSFVFVFIFLKQNILSIIIKKLNSFMGGIASTGEKIWPNVYSSVAELKTIDFQTILDAVGGQFVFLIALIGIFYLSLDFKEKDDSKNKYKMPLYILGILYLFLESSFSLKSNER